MTVGLLGGVGSAGVASTGAGLAGDDSTSEGSSGVVSAATGGSIVRGLGTGGGGSGGGGGFCQSPWDGSPAPWVVTVFFAGVGATQVGHSGAAIELLNKRVTIGHW